MPRPEGVFTFEAGRWRNQGGQFVPEQAVLGPETPPKETSHDDAFEMLHGDHVAGASTPGWLRQMVALGTMQPCLGCGQSIGIADVTLHSEHTRDWGRPQEPKGHA